MMRIIAYADAGDASPEGLTIIVGGIAIIGVIAVMTLFLLAAVRARRHRYIDIISTATVFWALITAGTVLYAAARQMRWSREYDIQLRSGYLDPQSASGPRWPWMVFMVLGAIYAMLLAWAYSGKDKA